MIDGSDAAVHDFSLAKWETLANDELNSQTNNDAPDEVKRVIQGSQKMGLHARFYLVESDYYDWTLERRMYVQYSKYVMKSKRKS
jgi:hypothetical protein